MPPSITYVSGTSTAPKNVLVFFVTGNPGLIGYYETFFSKLSGLLSSRKDAAITIYGQSLKGFEDGDGARASPYSLAEIVTASYATLTTQFAASRFDSIILMGHSVGSYIALELLRLSSASASPSPFPITGAILLFPTVTHIAQSPSGLKLTTLLRIPEFPRRASILARWLLWPVPARALDWLVGVVTAMSAEGKAVTLRFLRADGAVWQALRMASDEMEIITEDRWGAEIWGADDGKDAPKLVFFFGRHDHWVAEHTRDALIEARSRGQGSKPKMVLDDAGIPHAFCIHHSEETAERVKVWIDEILDGLVSEHQLSMSFCDASQKAMRAVEGLLALMNGMGRGRSRAGLKTRALDL